MGVSELGGQWGSGHPPLDSAAESQAWRNFLKAAVARYGPGGTYWATGGKYDQDYGTSATPLPIQSWQIWNEPNLKKYFSPGSTIHQVAKSTPGCCAISHDTIKSQGSAGHDRARRDARANGDVKAWKFLNYLYKVTGVKGDFDAAALHPYGSDLERARERDPASSARR